MLFAGAALGASPLQVVEAVLPDWPVGEAKTQKGYVTVAFAVYRRGAFGTEVVDSDLPVPFGVEAMAALSEWLMQTNSTGRCAPVYARQTFLFDGYSEENVDLGELMVEPVPAHDPIVAMDRVEIEAGRLRRNREQRDYDAEVAKRRAAESALWQRTQERWERAGAGRYAAYQVPDLTPPKPAIRIEPQYPRGALTHGIAGDVWARIKVDSDGNVADLNIEAVMAHNRRASDTEMRAAFGSATRRALQRWRFQPALDSTGRAVDSEVCQLISYRLQSVD